MYSKYVVSVILQTEKGGRKFWKDRLGENEAALPGEDLLQIEDGKPLTFEFLTGKKVEQVGSLNPVEDFEALLARRDSDQWVTKAIKGMKKIITDLLNSAYNGNTYEKAVTCLIALRRGCVIQEVRNMIATGLSGIIDNVLVSWLEVACLSLRSSNIRI